jgi:hypothetical protein
MTVLELLETKSMIDDSFIQKHQQINEMQLDSEQSEILHQQNERMYALNLHNLEQMVKNSEESIETNDNKKNTSEESNG